MGDETRRGERDVWLKSHGGMMCWSETEHRPGWLQTKDCPSQPHQPGKVKAREAFCVKEAWSPDMSLATALGGGALRTSDGFLLFKVG